jgi:hypothetical protein
MQILVCGGRQFEDAGFLWKALDLLNTELQGGISDVIIVLSNYGSAETEVGRGSA